LVQHQYERVCKNNNRKEIDVTSVVWTQDHNIAWNFIVNGMNTFSSHAMRVSSLSGMDQIPLSFPRLGKVNTTREAQRKDLTAKLQWIAATPASLNTICLDGDGCALQLQTNNNHQSRLVLKFTNDLEIESIKSHVTIAIGCKLFNNKKCLKLW
jgi:hypothetical protein